MAGAALARTLRRTVYVLVAGLAAAMLLFPLLGTTPAGGIALLVLWGLSFGGVSVSLQNSMIKAAPQAVEGGSLHPGDLREPALRVVQHRAAAGRAEDQPGRDAHRGVRRPRRPPALQRRPRRRTAPPAVARLRAAVLAADGLLIVTSEDNYSIPAALKNGLDWCSTPLEGWALDGKPVAIAGASPTAMGTARAPRIINAGGRALITPPAPAPGPAPGC